MNNSILNSVKEAIGINSDEQAFDNDVVMIINSAFMTLNQSAGVGPIDGFAISNDQSVWSDFSTDPKIVSLTKDYVCVYTKLAFDPPASSTIIQSAKERRSELEWRLSVLIDTRVTTPSREAGD